MDAMKFLLLVTISSLSIAVMAQQPVIKDSVPLRAKLKNNQPGRKATMPVSTKDAIEAELNNIVASYTDRPNTAATWVQIRSAAEDVLSRYFRDGKLKGNKASEAYFVKMDISTMTSADITNKRMILLAGIAIVKPAEFTLLVIEKKCQL
jgi:phage tail sheath protein FI